MISKQQAKYYAYKLTILNREGNLSNITQGLLNAQVDLNPHQIEAATFALNSPLSKGAILADEVGLGKTIEAGIVLCQYWVERKRHLLIVCPASLREQWKIELEEKFSLPSIILDSKNYFTNLLNLKDKIIIISYNFASKIHLDLVRTSWDLAVIDEAHKLRNVYRESNVIANDIEYALRDRKKLLLTATPLQNSLMELYGLSLLIDRNMFGSTKSFKSQYSLTQTNYESLKERLEKFCKRTLRANVLEYIRYTKRKPFTFPFVPSEQEQELYDKISDFLKEESVYAIPAKQKHLVSLILYKLLTSSSSAIEGTLTSILKRLEKIKSTLEIPQQDKLEDELIQDIENEYEQEYQEENQQNKEEVKKLDIEILDKEIEEVEEYIELAKKIKADNKTLELLKALTTGFKELEKLGANKKVLIFTESRRTQRYLFEYLSNNGYAEQIIEFNGSNKIHRNELIEQFKNKFTIMIATEAGAEGLNMQFCSLVVNYDLPWNPQRVEQRIGRCHRYGQQYDVVVINFINKNNRADNRVFELLSEKFKLFEGVFGASDEILGSIEDGIDFEKRILKIYQTCRTTEEIDTAFNNLRTELEEQITQEIKRTKKKILDTFDADVHERLKVNLEETKTYLNKYQKMFWTVAKETLKEDGIFDDTEYSFILTNPNLGILKKYYFITQDKKINADSDSVIRLSSNLGEHIINTAKNFNFENTDEIVFNLSNTQTKHTYLQKMKQEHRYGWCSCYLMTLNSFEKEEYLVLSGMDNYQKEIDQETLEEILKLEVSSINTDNIVTPLEKELLEKIQESNIQKAKENSENINRKFFNEEAEKINRYIEDKLYVIEKELKDVRDKIKTLQKQETVEENISRKLTLQEELAKLSKQKRNLQQKIFNEEDKIEEERQELINNLKKKVASQIKIDSLFLFKWKLN